MRLLEIKHDGYRLMVRRASQGMHIKTRRGFESTDCFPLIVEAASRLRATFFVLDGEGVILRQDGVADFDRLHARRHDGEVQLLGFDLLELDWTDLLRDRWSGVRLAKIGFLASHGESSMQAILRAIADGSLSATPCVVICNNADASALTDARTLGIPSYHLSGSKLGAGADLDRTIAGTLEACGAELVVLSGYLRKLGPHTLMRYRSRILNVHPGLLPRYGGRGMYGRRVHEAVIAAGERVTGITIHLVDAEYDRGPTSAQCEIPVETGDTAATLVKRIEALEPYILVETLRRIADGALRLPPLENSA